MSSNRQLEPTSVSTLLTELIGRDVSASALSSPEDANAPGYVAAYVNAEGKPVALCRCSLPVAASLGAALSLVPPGRVDDCVKQASLDELLLENFGEVCNVLVRIFNAPNEPPLSLGPIHSLPLSDDAGVDLSAEPAFQVNMGVQVQGYGKGSLSLVRL